MRIGIINVRVGADANKQLFAILRKDDVACPMATPRRQVCDVFRLAFCLQISTVIGKAQNSVGIADIDILWAWSGRVESNAIRLF